MVLAIPAGSFESSIRACSRLGAVDHLATTADNVTGEVEDLGAEKSALVVERAQLVVLLARAGSIPALLSVQNEITSVQTQIDEIDAQQRAVAGAVDYSSLTVTLEVPARRGRPPVSRWPVGSARRGTTRRRHS